MENAQEYSLKLKDKKEIANKTMAFYFEKPEGFSFVPGQSMDLFYPRNDEKKTFSLASAPYEDYLLFAMRLRGTPFKKYLSKMKAGDTIAARGPFGERFVLPEDANTPLVFIAGGIGITPILSMISYIVHDKLGTPITLFYSNKNEGDISFRKKLEQYKKENHNITMVFTLSNKYSVPPSWEGEVGRVNRVMIRKYIRDITVSLFYTSGTPMMVTSMQDALERAGVPKERIVTKKFTGYE